MKKKKVVNLPFDHAQPMLAAMDDEACLGVLDTFDINDTNESELDIVEEDLVYAIQDYDLIIEMQLDERNSLIQKRNEALEEKLEQSVIDALNEKIDDINISISSDRASRQQNVVELRQVRAKIKEFEMMRKMNNKETIAV